MKPSTQITWQRWPALPFPTSRPRIRLALAPSAEAPSLARRAIGGLGAELSEDELFVSQLLMSELVTNVVLHAGGMSPRRATATVWVCPERLRIDVLDRGAGFRPRVAKPDPEREDGRGLQLVDEFADDWGVVPGPGSWVWCELAREAADQLASTRRSARTGTPGGSVDSSKRRRAPFPIAANEARTPSAYPPLTTAAPAATPLL
jgi:anti-sigma regulatory factor (Ser/Thr protein kinase)